MMRKKEYEAVGEARVVLVGGAHEQGISVQLTLEVDVKELCSTGARAMVIRRAMEQLQLALNNEISDGRLKE